MDQIYRFYSKDNTDTRVSVVGGFDTLSQTFKFAASRCSAKDRFNKKIGRAIAEGRLKKNHIVHEVTDNINGKLFVTVASVIAGNIAKNPKLIF